MNYNDPQQQQQYLMQQRMAEQRMMMQQQQQQQQQQQMRPQQMQYTIQQPGPPPSMQQNLQQLTSAQLSDFVKTLPREFQMSIKNEKDMSRRMSMIYSEYYKRRDQQHSMQPGHPQFQHNPQIRMMPNGPMNGGQIMYNMGQQPMPNQPQPMMSGQMPMQRSQQPYSTQPIPGQMQAAHGQPPSRFALGQPMPPMQPQPILQPTQPQPPAPSSVPNAQQPVGQLNQNSPMPAVAASSGGPHAGPGTPRSVTSTGSAGTTKNTIDVNATDYRETFDSLKKYHSQCLRLLDRNRLDGNIELEKTLQRIIEVMEGRRVVDRKLLEKLIKNIEVTLTKQSSIRGLIEFVKRLTHTPDLGAMHGILPDPWADVRHLQIKVPDEIKNTIREKRKYTIDSIELPITAKRSKIEERLGMVERKDSHLLSKIDSDNDQIQVQCLNGRVVLLSKYASEELKKVGFRIDPDLAPISEHDPHVTILVDHKTNHFLNPIQPLRLLVPKDYPEGSPLQFFCESHDVLKRMKIHSNVSQKHSISQIVSVYRNVVV